MHNHPKVIDYTKLPILEDALSFKSGLYKHPPLDDLQACSKVDCTKHPISDDLEIRSLSSKIGSYKLSKFG